LSKKTIVKEWGIKPWEMGRLTARDLQDIRLAEHAERFIQQEQRNQQESGGSVNTKTGIENRESKQQRIREAKRKYIQ